MTTETLYPPSDNCVSGPNTEPIKQRISERARVKLVPDEMPANERTISEMYRLCAKEWVEAEKAASLLEETKSATLAQLVLELGDIPVNRAEMRVKGGPKWKEFIVEMVEARAAANLARVRLKYCEMLHTEDMCRGAAERAERRMTR